jgi:hypothetical protein
MSSVQWIFVTMVSESTRAPVSPIKSQQNIFGVFHKEASFLGSFESNGAWSLPFIS